METRAADDAHARDCDDQRAADDSVPRRFAQRRLADRAGEVVRNEERGERHDDEEVEEENPARGEARKVVERTSHERRSAAGLRKGRRPFRVRERDEDEDAAGDQKNEGCQAERRRRDDAERDVERRGDLPVCDREEGGSVEDTLEAAELTGHRASARASAGPRPER